MHHSENERQLSVNDFWVCILGYISGNWLQTSVHKVVAAFSITTNSDTFPALAWKWVWTEPQRCLVMYIG